MPIQVTTDAFADSIRLDIHDLTRELIDNVGATVVAAMTGAGSRSLPYKWADKTEPRREAEDRLRLGYRVWRTVRDAEKPHVALAWLVGANPRLGEATPVTFIRELRTRDVVGAAVGFIEDVPA
ncbi:hypothetical protein [Isoptericola sp. NPDC019482]|uniref:hypothetical protein n=1 Tax=Isoptericola sp. NPDC019482 TaxID=3154688 RepID=UPI00348B98F7